MNKPAGYHAVKGPAKRLSAQVTAASRLLELPKEQIKIIVCSKGGLDLCKADVVLFPQALTMAEALPEQQAKEDTVCTNKAATSSPLMTQSPRTPSTSMVGHLRRNVQTRHLAFLVALILSASFLTLMLVWTLRKSQDDKGHVLAVGQFGTYYGTRSTVSGVAVGAFLGVPYADPRTLRFGAPVPWYRDQEVFDNTAAAPSCAQASPSLDEMNASTSEDCLHLNIWAPACGLHPCSGNRTVVVFIHGGFFQTGSNNDPHYDGRALAALGDVVVVVPNWRLGVLGFLSLARSDDVPINVGLLDQAEVLRWTARNVDAFGGNKSDLVVVGHGSGASALTYHLMLGQGLSDVAPILKVVLMSESPMTRYPVPNRGQESGHSEYSNAPVRRLCEEAEQIKSSLLSCLRKLPVEELLRRQRGDSRELPQFFPMLPVMWPTRLWKELKVSTVRFVSVTVEDAAFGRCRLLEEIYREIARRLRTIPEALF
nr:cholinesterase-like [Dermacentor andersoni]